MHAVVQQASDKQIIYIDDDKIQGLAAKEILEHLGHGATTFSDSAEAKDAILATPDAWDVVITECRRRPNFDHLCRLNFDQGTEAVL